MVLLTSKKFQGITLVILIIFSIAMSTIRFQFLQEEWILYKISPVILAIILTLLFLIRYNYWPFRNQNS
jgi:membrane protein YdbS with pleckstrin-like domain